jgi:hydroxyacylglutathione hydrolase
VALDVEMLTVGQIAENCFLFRKEGSDKALIVDPGEEPERILAAAQEMGVTVEAIHPLPLRPHRRRRAGG